MPEPFQNRMLSPRTPNPSKAFIGVYSYTDLLGNVVPSRIRWEDGQEWDVDRVLEVREAHATKAGGFGIRYTVRIGSHQRMLFHQEDGRWFVELGNTESKL